MIARDMDFIMILPARFLKTDPERLQDVLEMEVFIGHAAQFSVHGFTISCARVSRFPLPRSTNGFSAFRSAPTSFNNHLLS